MPEAPETPVLPKTRICQRCVPVGSDANDGIALLQERIQTRRPGITVLTYRLVTYIGRERADTCGGRGLHLDRRVCRSPLEIEAMGRAVVVGEVAEEDVGCSAVRRRRRAPHRLRLGSTLPAREVVVVGARKENAVKSGSRRQQARLYALAVSWAEAPRAHTLSCSCGMHAMHACDADGNRRDTYAVCAVAVPLEA